MRILHKWPFTSLLLAALALTGILTQTHRLRLSQSWLTVLGFSPADLGRRQGRRIITSALVTNGAEVFWQALSFTAVFSGLAEYMAGTRRAAAAFWGVHIVTLLSESLLVLWPLRLWNLAWSEAMALARDVGPSAGYFGCLGLVCQKLPGRWRGLISGGIFSLLFGVLFLPLRKDETRAVKLTADIAHLMAFPSGWLLGWVMDKMDRRSEMVR